MRIADMHSELAVGGSARARAWPAVSIAQATL